MNSEIDFKPDGGFKLDIKSQDKFAADLIEMIEGTQWKYNGDLDWIMIGTEEDEYTIIGFQFFIRDDQTYLKIPDSGILLQIEK